MIRAIIFDCFGVLAGSSYKEIYKNSGGDLDSDGQFISELLELANSNQINTGELHARIAKRLGKSVDEWVAIVRNNELPNLELLEYIQTLKPNYKLAILSNAGVGVMQRKFSAEQLAIFDQVVVSAEVGFMKPQPEIYEITANGLGVEVQECVFVDDLMPYVNAATELGMKSIQYKDFEQLKQDLEAILNHK